MPRKLILRRIGAHSVILPFHAANDGGAACSPCICVNIQVAVRVIIRVAFCVIIRVAFCVIIRVAVRVNIRAAVQIHHFHTAVALSDMTPCV